MPLKIVKLVKRVRPYLIGEEIGLESEIADRYIKLGVAIPLGVKAKPKAPQKPTTAKPAVNKKPAGEPQPTGQTSPGVVPNR